MLLLISGSVIATLNDDTNFQLRNTWELETAEYSSARGYADCKEQLTIGITATTVTGVRTNIATLFKLQEDVAAWKQNQHTPVTMHYTPEGTNTTYRTLITDLKLTLPKDIHIAQTLRGIPNATLEYTRKGLWLSGSEGYTQTTSGFSGNVVTITGLIAQSVYSPTNMTISGFIQDEDNNYVLPRGYIFLADRNSSNSPAIDVSPASGLNASWTTTTYNGESVARSDLDSTYITSNNFKTNRPAAITLLNAYEKVHIFGVIDNEMATNGWYTQINIIPTTTAWVPNSDRILSVPADDEKGPHTYYLGTITRSPLLPVRDISIEFFATTTPTAGYLYVHSFIFVADTDGTNIVYIQDLDYAGSFTTGRFEGRIRNNYLSSDPTFLLNQTTTYVATLKTATMISGAYPYPQAVGDVSMQTKAATVDMLTSLHNEFWRYTPSSPGAFGKYQKLGLMRDKATLIPGV